ncbi:MAG: acyl--CoA ligase [Mogibacterium sp.]|nr:acyl--CoA ligase [Mogibacterium sp.]MBR3376513.1 acyl--CoA ligase [Mogibacterium sp.]
MYKKFSSFEELVLDFKKRDLIALKFADDEDNIHEISYAELAEMIISETERIKAKHGDIEVVRDEQSPETIVSIFAHVMAGCDIIMADPMVPDDAVSKASAAAAAAKAARPKTEGEGELLFFTSGTTSRSKIVRLTSRSFCTSAWSGQSMLACGEGDVILSILPLSHVFGFVCSMLWGFAYGATIALGRGVRHIIDDTLFFRPTILPAVPTLIGAMLKYDTLNPELKVALIGAAPCTAEVTAALRAKGIDVYLGYGLTETSSGIAITQDLDEPEALYPCPGADFRIEEDGEVTIATPCMMQGYIGAEPMFEGDRFFTGDLGWFDDKGRLHLKGRKKDVLLMADGTKIFCPEYEEELERLTGLPDLGVTMKDGHAVLVAGSLSNDPAIEADMRAKLLKTVGKYNKSLQRSQQIYDVIVRAESLPRTATGKIKRYELQEQINK